MDANNTDYLLLCEMMIRKIKNLHSDYIKYKNQKNCRVRFYNWWPVSLDNNWFYLFMNARNILPDNKTISFCSVFGRRRIMKFVSGPKVFYSGENVHLQMHSSYSDYLLTDGLSNLSLGFDYFDSPDYLRFPLWLMYMFRPDSTKEDIVRRCEQLRYPTIKKRNLFASMISRYDWDNKRTEICNLLKVVGKVYCPSDVMHNDDTLRLHFSDCKTEYLKQFRFNICPENSNCKGYVSEKIFEAIDSGCIPIYHGSNNVPEIEVLNQSAIIFVDDTNKFVSDVSYLENNPCEYLKFALQPRLVDGAEEWIIHKFDTLEQRIKVLLYD